MIADNALERLCAKLYEEAINDLYNNWNTPRNYKDESHNKRM